MIYDIIGDIHGQADKLIGLLNQLGYRLIDGVYVPPDNHQAIFVGDLIDRGAHQLQVLTIVFDMLDKGYAQAVMGNHEYNAIAYSVYHHGDYLRPHSLRNTAQHQAFLEEAPFNSPIHRYWINRFYELPLWLHLNHLCVIHACWDNKAIQQLDPYLDNHRLNQDSLINIHDQQLDGLIDILLKGLEAPLPDGVYLTDKDGITRDKVRLKWWQWQKDRDLSYRPINTIARVPKTDLLHLPCTPIGKVDFKINTYKPIFIGHYWLTGTPTPLSDQVVCVDYSAGGDGVLVAFCFDSDKSIDEGVFVY